MPDVGRVVRRPASSSRRHSSACQTRSSSSGFAGTVGVAALAPVGDQRSAAGTAYDANRPASRRGDGVAAVAPQLRLVAVEAVAEVGGQRGAPRLVEAGRRWSRAAARPAGRGPTGRRARGRAAARPASAGCRNRTPAHTPSPPRGAGAEPVARAAGSATARRPWPAPPRPPAANGSSSGVDNSSPRASASRSVRGARWRWSTTARPYAPGPTVPPGRRDGSNSVSSPLSRCCSTQTVGWTLSYTKCASRRAGRQSPQKCSRSSSAFAAASTAAIASGLPWNFR